MIQDVVIHEPRVCLPENRHAPGETYPQGVFGKTEWVATATINGVSGCYVRDYLEPGVDPAYFQPMGAFRRLESRVNGRAS